ncbi:MAG: hypothetical protein WC477_03335 [Patescibacteria group bacterium]
MWFHKNEVPKTQPMDEVSSLPEIKKKSGVTPVLIIILIGLAIVILALKFWYPHKMTWHYLTTSAAASSSAVASAPKLAEPTPFVCGSATFPDCAIVSWSDLVLNVQTVSRMKCPAGTITLDMVGKPSTLFTLCDCTCPK